MSGASRPAPGPRLATFEGILAVCLLAFLALVLLVTANPAVRGIDRDSGFYLYIGSQILHGKLPYLDAWESKPPAIFYLNALALWLAHGSRWGVWAFELLSLFAALYVAYHIMRKEWGSIPALVGVAAFAIGFVRTFEHGNYTEEYPLPLHFLAIALYLRLRTQPGRRLENFLLGILFACTFLFRANNAAPEAAVILALAVEQALRRPWRPLIAQLVWIGVGAALPILVTVGYFWSRGLLQELLDASIVYNLTYSGTEITASSPLEVGLRAFGWSVLLLAAAGYVLALVSLRRPAAHRPLSLLLLIGMPMAILLSDPARRTYLHYYMSWLPFLALLGALAAAFIVSRWGAARESSPWLSLSALGVGVVAAVAYLAWSGGAADVEKAGHMFLQRGVSGIEETPVVAAYVGEHTKPGDTVLFWGAYPAYNFMSHRDSPSAVMFYPLFVPSRISQRLEARFMLDLQTRRPVLIVDMNDTDALSLDASERQQQMDEGLGWAFMPSNLDEVLGFIRGNYVLLAKVSGHAVYVLKGGILLGVP